VTYFLKFRYPLHISGTVFLFYNLSNVADACTTGQNGTWLRSPATSRSSDLLNLRATDALRNGKILASINFDFQRLPDVEVVR